MVDRVLAGRDPLPLYGACERRAFCYIDDAVDTTLRLMALPGREPVVGLDRGLRLAYERAECEAARQGIEA